MPFIAYSIVLGILEFVHEEPDLFMLVVLCLVARAVLGKGR